MKFYIDGREYEDYQLSNEQIVRLLNSVSRTNVAPIVARTTTTCLLDSSAASLTASAIILIMWQS